MAMDDQSITDSQRLAVIESIVLDLRIRLFGRDQEAGVIGHLEARVATIEKWQRWIMGIGVGIAFASGMGAKTLLEMMRK